MPEQLYRESSETDPDLFDTHEAASNYLEEQVLGYGECQFVDNQVETAKIDGVKLTVAEYEDGWGFEAHKVDGEEPAVNGELSEFLEP